MRKRRILIILAIACFVAATAWYLHQKSPPYVARLLPESDAIVYFDLEPLRAVTHFNKSPITPSPAYQQFIDATGIQPENDLNQAAFALTRMADSSGPNGPVAFSEVFTGRFDTARLTRYLASQATSQEIYASHSVYRLPSDGRVLRVTILDSRTIAASNAPTPEQLHSIIDRSSSIGLFGGPSMLTSLYGDVPALSPAWALGHIALPFVSSGRLSIGGLELPLSAENTFVASVRFLPALSLNDSTLNLRVDQLTVSRADAEQSTQALNNLLALGRTLAQSHQSDPGINQFFDSIAIDARNDRATLSAALPISLLRRVAARQH